MGVKLKSNRLWTRRFGAAAMLRDLAAFSSSVVRSASLLRATFATASPRITVSTPAGLETMLPCMTTLALQLAADALTWSRLPDPLAFDEDNPVAGHRVQWPRVQHPRRGQLPLTLEERVLTYALVGSLLADTEAEIVLLAVEEGVDRARVGVVEVALDHADVRVDLAEPHPDGAAGVIRDAAEGIVRQTPRPPA